MIRRLIESFSKEPLGAFSLLATLLSFLVPTGITFWKDWEAGKPKINIFCKDLGESTAFFQSRDSNGARRTNWSSPSESNQAINGYIAVLPNCELYNLQSTTVSIRNISNSMYYDRYETNELPDFSQFFDAENDIKLKDVPSKFPIVLAPGAGIRFKGIILFPVGNIAASNSKDCKSLSAPDQLFANFSRCVSEIHDKPLVNLLLEGQQIGLGGINAVGMKVVLADNSQINYIPTMMRMPYKENKGIEKLRGDAWPLFTSKGETWITYPDDREYIRIGSQYILWSFWSLLFFFGLLLSTLTIFYLTVSGFTSVWRKQRGKNSTHGQQGVGQNEPDQNL